MKPLERKEGEVAPTVRYPRGRVRSPVLLFLLIIGLAVLVWYALGPITQTDAPGGGGGRGGRGGRRGSALTTGVSLASVERGDMTVMVRALGTVTSTSTVTVRTQVTGQLQS